MSTSSSRPQHVPEELVEKYGDLKHKVGRGTFGSVWQTSKGYAVKVMNGTFFSSFVLETALMRYIQSPYIMELEDAYVAADVNLEEDEDVAFIVMPLGRGLELEEIPEDPQQFFRELVRGVMDLHAANVIHGDLKPQNCVDFEGLLRLTDFGISRFYTCLQPNLGSTFQTLWWRSPSLLLGESLQRADDVWALGVILYHWMTGKLPFEGNSDIDQLFQIFRAFGTPTDETWPGVEKLPEYKQHFPKWEVNPKFLKAISDPEARDLVKGMLEMNPADRLSVFEVFQHPFVGGQPALELTYSPEEPPDCTEVLEQSVLDSELEHTFMEGTDMTPRIFNIVADWLVDAAQRFGMLLLTFGHATTFLRWIATNMKISRNKVQLVACATGYLSSALYDQYASRAIDWEWISAKNAKPEDLFKTIRILLENKNFDLIWSSPVSFVAEEYPASKWGSGVNKASILICTSWYMGKYSTEEQGQKILELYHASLGQGPISSETQEDIEAILAESDKKLREKREGLLRDLNYPL